MSMTTTNMFSDVLVIFKEKHKCLTKCTLTISSSNF